MLPSSTVAACPHAQDATPQRRSGVVTVVTVSRFTVLHAQVRAVPAN